jgi:hypothetical protein
MELEAKNDHVFGGASHLCHHIRPYTAGQIRALQSELEALSTVLNWVETFLARPNPMLGREGKVCPFVPESLGRNALQFFVVRLTEKNPNDTSTIEKYVHYFRDYFIKQEQMDGKVDIFRSLIMIFPDVTAEEAPFLIDSVQKKLKATFVKEGLMLGEFHALNDAPGLRNPDFRPLRSPIPLLAIRHMVESDLDFLNRLYDHPSQRIEFLNAYLQFLGASLSPGNRKKAQEALAAAEREVAIIA